jgi:hypothetical protein
VCWRGMLYLDVRKNQRADRLIAAGRCPRHKDEFLIPGLLRCEKCRESKRNSAFKAAQAGRCRNHPTVPVVAGTATCAQCLERQQKWVRQQRAVKKCINCVKPALPGNGFCEQHYFYAAAYRLTNGELVWEELRDLWNSQAGCCALTGKKLILGVNTSLDHKIPMSRGGTDQISNLQWVEDYVNFAKADRTTEEFEIWLLETAAAVSVLKKSRRTKT